MSVKAKSPGSTRIKTNDKPAGNSDTNRHLPAYRFWLYSGLPPIGGGNAFVQFKLEFDPHTQEKGSDVIEIRIGAGTVIQSVNPVTGVQFGAPVFQILNHVNCVG